MLGLASTACTRENSGTPQPVETSQQTSTAAAAEGVELLDPGAEPRETLRLTLTEGSRSRATMTTTMRIGLQIGDEPTEDTAVPPTVVEMTAAVDQIVPNGDIHYTVTMDNFRAGEGPACPRRPSSRSTNFPASPRGRS